MDLSRRLERAVSLAKEAGALTLDFFGADDLEVDSKADGSPVTRADRGAEELLRERLRAEFPGDGILGEEYGEEGGSSGARWILDPVDGTFSFARGVPLYGTQVAWEREGEAVLGVVHLPALSETVFAARGLGATWERADGERRRARVSGTARLADALFCTTYMGGWEKRGELGLYDALRRAAGSDRGYPDCYGHMLVATGRADVMVDPDGKIWDAAAIRPIVEEAGGRFFTLEGEESHQGGSLVSTNGRIAEEVLAVIREWRG